jgi:glutamate/tyrosine decarboxylase-like PLP-dependent enzyme
VRAIRAIERVESITLDPHKLGYVPFSSGAILVRNPLDYFLRTFDSPYLDRGDPRERGPYTLEGSRSGGGATATWMTSRVIGFNAGGYGRILSRTIRMKQEFERRLLDSGLPVHIAPGCDTNVLCFHLAFPGEPLARSNTRMLDLYKRLPPKYVVSKTTLQWGSHEEYLREFVASWKGGPAEGSGDAADLQPLVLLRVVLMNPFFESQEMNTDFIGEFIRLLKADLMKRNMK